MIEGAGLTVIEVWDLRTAKVRSREMSCIRTPWMAAIFQETWARPLAANNAAPLAACFNVAAAFAVGRCDVESEASSYGMWLSAWALAPSNALHGTLRPRPKKKPRTRITTATSRKTLARLAERPATPPNPRSAAMSATTAKMMAQRNMRPLPRYKRCVDLFEQPCSKTFELPRCSADVFVLQKADKMHNGLAQRSNTLTRQPHMTGSNLRQRAFHAFTTQHESRS